MLRGERESRRGWGKAQGKERRGTWRGECTWRGEKEGRRRSGKGRQGEESEGTPHLIQVDCDWVPPSHLYTQNPGDAATSITAVYNYIETYW